MLAGEQEDGHGAERDARRPARRGAATGSARATTAARGAATSGSKCAPSREICCPWRSVISRNRPCAVDQTACVRLPTSNRPVSKARCWSTASADIPAAKRADRDPRAARAAGSRGCDRALEQRPPARAEDRLARPSLVRRAAGRADRAAQSAARRRAAGRAVASALGVARRDEERVVCRPSAAPGPQGCPPSRVACRRRVPGMPCSGSRGAAFAPVPKIPSAQPAAWISPGRSLVLDPRDPLDVGRPAGEEGLELAAADDHGTGPRGRAPRRRGSSRARAAGSACRRRARGTARPAASRGGRAGPRRRRSTPRRGRPAGRTARRKNAAWASVSATTTSARRNARRSTSVHDAGAGEPRRKRPRSPTSVS